MSHSPASENEFDRVHNDQSAFRKSLQHINELMRQGGSLSGHERNCLFLNTRGGPFATASAVSGLDYDDDGRGAVIVDWDGDGDLDVWTSNRTSPRVRLLRNNQPQPRSVSLLLKGESCNRDAVGAQARLYSTNDPTKPITKTVRAGEGYLSQSTKWLTFGLGEADEVSHIEIDWPGGSRQTINSLQPGRYFVVESRDPTRVATRTGFRDYGTEPTADRSASSQSVTQPQTGRVALTMPIACPSLPYTTDTKGRSSIQNALEGTGPTLVNLWASWCRPCLEELKELSDHSAELDATGLRVVAICVDAELADSQPTNDPTADSTMAKLPFELPFQRGLATTETLDRLKTIHGLPFAIDVEMPVPLSFLVSRSQRVVAIYRGKLAIETLLADVAALQRGETAWQSRALPLPGRWNEQPKAANQIAMARDLLSRNQTNDALQFVQRFAGELQDKELPLVRAWLGDQLIANGRAQEGLLQYKAALADSPNDLTLINNYAWQLAVQQDESLRNGKLAVEWSLRAARITGNKNPGILDTLAASYAEAGDFEKAVAVARSAVQRAPAGLAQRIGNRLRLYERGLPYREQRIPLATPSSGNNEGGSDGR